MIPRSSRLFQRRSSQSAHALWLAIALSLGLSAGAQKTVASQAFHVGLDFIESTIPAPPAFSTPPFEFDFNPFTLTNPANHFVSQGGLSGWTEDQTRRAVALAVDDAFRAIDVGDPNRTVRISFHLGPVSMELAGQRMNLVFAQPSAFPPGLLGQARQAAYNDSQATDTIVAVTYLNEINELGESHLTYDTPESVINTIAGTTAHELGHVFDAKHFQEGTFDGITPDPWPLMAIEQVGLPTLARQTERRFSPTEPAALSNADQIVTSAGTTLLGDLNLDNLVDALDAGLLFANWGLSDRLYYEGDVNGDHWVDAADAAIMFTNWLDMLPGSGSPTSFPATSPSTLAFDRLQQLAQVPEPTSLTLLAGWLVGWLGLSRRRTGRS